LQSFRQSPESKHFLFSIQLDVIGEEITAIVYWMYSQDGISIISIGRDNVLFKKEDTSWKIKSMVIIPILNMI